MQIAKNHQIIRKCLTKGLNFMLKIFQWNTTPLAHSKRGIMYILFPLQRVHYYLQLKSPIIKYVNINRHELGRLWCTGTSIRDYRVRVSVQTEYTSTQCTFVIDVCKLAVYTRLRVCDTDT